MRIRTNRQMIAELQRHDLDLQIVFHDGAGIATVLADVGVDGTCGDGTPEQPDECLRVQLCDPDEDVEAEEFESSAVQIGQTPAQMVLEFHETYNCAIGMKPELPKNQDLRNMRMAILKEEWNEYLEAEDDNNIVEIADALADIIYIAYGTAIAYGIDLDAVITEVHRSNMSKLGADGKPITREDGKVLKGPNYFKPGIKKVLGL